MECWCDPSKDDCSRRNDWGSHNLNTCVVPTPAAATRLRPAVPRGRAVRCGAVLAPWPNVKAA